MAPSRRGGQGQERGPALVDVGVDYSSDLARVERIVIDVGRQVMTEVCSGVPEFEPFIRDHTFGDSSVNFTTILRAREFVDQYLVKHEFVKRLHQRFDHRRISGSTFAGAPAEEGVACVCPPAEAASSRTPTAAPIGCRRCVTRDRIAPTSKLHALEQWRAMRAFLHTPASTPTASAVSDTLDRQPARPVARMTARRQKLVAEPAMDAMRLQTRGPRWQHQRFRST
jgi:hypothetical protein